MKTRNEEKSKTKNGGKQSLITSIIGKCGSLIRSSPVARHFRYGLRIRNIYFDDANNSERRYARMVGKGTYFKIVRENFLFFTQHWKVKIKNQNLRKFLASTEDNSPLNLAWGPPWRCLSLFRRHRFLIFHLRTAKTDKSNFIIIFKNRKRI